VGLVPPAEKGTKAMQEVQAPSVRELRTDAPLGDSAFQSDAELLDAFVHDHDESAMEALVWRHGPMVLNLCRRILRDEHLAEDAFQAAFMELLRGAGSIDKGQSVSSWLFKVAYRVAHRQRSKMSKEPAQSPNIDDYAARPAADAVIWRDLRPVLDEEIDRLPEKYRAPIVLCYLQGHTTGEAAEVLRRPKGTVLSHLSRGREQLRSRLTRRGVALTAAWLATHLSANVSSAALPDALVESTVKSAVNFTADKPILELTVSKSAPAKGSSQAAFLANLKLLLAALLAASAVAFAAISIVHFLTDDDPFWQFNWTPAHDHRDAVELDDDDDSNQKSPGIIRYE